MVSNWVLNRDAGRHDNWQEEPELPAEWTLKSGGNEWAAVDRRRGRYNYHVTTLLESRQGRGRLVEGEAVAGFEPLSRVRLRLDAAKLPVLTHL